MGLVAHTAENRKTNRVLAKKPEGKRQHRRSRHRWDDNTKMDVKGNRMGHHGLGLFTWLRTGACPWLLTNRSNCAKTILIPK